MSDKTDELNQPTSKPEGMNRHSEKSESVVAKLNHSVSMTTSSVAKKKMNDSCNRSEAMGDILSLYKDLRRQVGDVEHSLLINIMAENELLHHVLEMKSEEIKRERLLRLVAEDELDKYHTEDNTLHPDKEQERGNRLKFSFENLKLEAVEKRRSERERQLKLEDELEDLLNEHKLLIMEKEAMALGTESPRTGSNTKKLSKEVPECTRRLYSKYSRSLSSGRKRSSARRPKGFLPPIKASSSAEVKVKVKDAPKNRSRRQTRSDVVLPSIENKVPKRIWRW